MADRLRIYNGALRLLGDHELSSLTEDHPARRKLDGAWTDSVDFLLTQGFWNFAIRTIELSYDTDYESAFGYTYAFSKPTDWVRTVEISATGDFAEGFEDYEDEQADYWYASIEKLYVRYVSDGTSYGWNVGAWRQTFAKALEAYLAFECGLPISSDRGNRNDLYSLYESRLSRAKTIDAVDQRVRRRPVGSLVRSRTSSRKNANRGL